MVLLPFLPPPAIDAYVRQRFATGAGLPIRELTAALQRRTEGNPLFLVRVLDYAVAQGILAHRDGEWALTAPSADLARLFPTSLRDLIGHQLAQLTDDERQVLEAASVVGEEFALAEVAAALELAPEVVDRCCETLARQRQLLVLGEPERWPDGTLTLRARFVHGLYRQAIHEQLLPTRPPTWHARIAERKAAAHGVHTEPIAAELATHFARAGDVIRAVHYHAQGGRYALRHQAHRVAVAQYTAGLELLARLPDTPERAAQEAELQVALGVAYMVLSGYSAPEVERAYGRARELCDRLGEAGPLFPTLYGLWGFYLARGEYTTARPLAERMLLIARQVDDAALHLQAHQALGLNDYCQGKFAAADEHLRQALALYDPRQHRGHLFQYGHDPAVLCLCYRAWALWMLGYPDQALRAIVDAVTLAREIGDASNLVLVLHGEHLVHGWRGEWSDARRCSEEAVRIAVQHELPFWVGMATIGLGAIVAVQGQPDEGLARLQSGLEVYIGTGARLGLAQALVAVAEVNGKVGHYEEAFSALAQAEALSETSGGDDHVAEVARVRGMLLLRQATAAPPASRQRRKPGARTGALDRPPHSSAVAAAEASLLRSRSRRSKARGPGSSAPPPASPLCGRGEASRTTVARCWPASSAGSQRERTRPTCATPGRCWRSWADLREELVAVL
jgi:predicted ATPase